MPCAGFAAHAANSEQGECAHVNCRTPARVVVLPRLLTLMGSFDCSVHVPLSIQFESDCRATPCTETLAVFRHFSEAAHAVDSVQSLTPLMPYAQGMVSAQVLGWAQVMASSQATAPSKLMASATAIESVGADGLSAGHGVDIGHGIGAGPGVCGGHGVGAGQDVGAGHGLGACSDTGPLRRTTIANLVERLAFGLCSAPDTGPSCSHTDKAHSGAGARQTQARWRPQLHLPQPPHRRGCGDLGHPGRGAGRAGDAAGQGGSEPPRDAVARRGRGRGVAPGATDMGGVVQSQQGGTGAGHGACESHGVGAGH